MQFLTLEDESGMIECTLFPRVNARYRGMIETVRGVGYRFRDESRPA